eukprot:gnl/Hemi2/25197_TR8471_c0_g1_i1.p1 gnl/Hemi2/25197_TR8471_c0_g1~~gnl/Hemi2/25197_TR8471_c0_g1_i1.p1  ORF type:complete len:241 (+),score=15.23 gnl/Hemi2/25197_TR8471_c0_g1_i1:209-931(+)
MLSPASSKALAASKSPLMKRVAASCGKYLIRDWSAARKWGWWSTKPEVSPVAGVEPFASSSTHSRVFLNIDLHDQPLGRLVFELADDVAPKTAEVFEALCSGRNGVSYQNTYLHHIVKGLLMKGGCLTTVTPLATTAPLPRVVRIPESVPLVHTRRGVLSLDYGSGARDPLLSRFIISGAALPHMPDKAVVFGKLVEGFEVLDAMEEAPVYKGTPTKPVRISSCGVLKTHTHFVNGTPST